MKKNAKKEWKFGNFTFKIERIRPNWKVALGWAIFIGVLLYLILR